MTNGRTKPGVGKQDCQDGRSLLRLYLSQLQSCLFLQPGSNKMSTAQSDDLYCAKLLRLCDKLRGACQLQLLTGPQVCLPNWDLSCVWLVWRSGQSQVVTLYNLNIRPAPHNKLSRAVLCPHAQIYDEGRVRLVHLPGNVRVCQTQAPRASTDINVSYEEE